MHTHMVKVHYYICDWGTCLSPCRCSISEACFRTVKQTCCKMPQIWHVNVSAATMAGHLLSLSCTPLICFMDCAVSQVCNVCLCIKLATIVYKCLHGLAPLYLADDCVPVTTVAGRRHLRSADSRCLVVPRTRTALGTHNFAVAGPPVWNSLPANLRSASASLRTFAGKLKTYLFQLP